MMVKAAFTYSTVKQEEESVVYIPRSLEVKVGIDELLDVTVSVENSEENSYNSHVIVTYPAGLSFRKFTILQGRIECDSLDSEGLSEGRTDCTIDKPIFKTNTTDCSVAQCGVFKCNMFMGILESKTLKISANLSSRWIQQIGLKSAKYLLTSTASLEYDRNQYIFFTTGSNNNPPIHKIELELQVYPQPDFTKEIVGGSLGGLALLALLTAGLYKAGFFKSKYNKMINANEGDPGAPLGSQTDGESLKLEMSQEGFSAAYVPKGFQMGIVGANQWKGGYMKYTSSGMKSGSYEPLNVESDSYLASARINCNFTLDSTRKAPNNRAYISEKQRMTNKSVDLDLRQPKCFDVNFFVELGFEINCGTDNNCVDNLKVDFNFTTSLEVKVGIDELLDVTVSVENSEENSYNSRVIVTYPAGLSFRKFTILQGKIECNSLDSEGLSEGRTDCTIDKPIFKTNTTDCSVAQCRVFKCNMFMGRLERKTLKISANLSSRWIQQIGLKSAKYLLTSTASLEYDRNQYIFFSTGSNNNPPIRKIEAEVEVYSEPDFTKEIVGGSLGGLALLALLTAGLYKAGFFKSKYNDMINADEADPGDDGEPEQTPEA
ncbi:Integrin alpha-X CD11 antigen-like family member C [Larimichthys crocea]|uniref:Integrin alpha-X CD11 antigen-like family member C n=1 Tax=Larimichthys crocea TaxID=215358 RepID=A0A6G0HZ31_LARCR|nr:Integrin alpha-X CD11 antigen-like family member C [Larimichthys crocea]